MIERLTAAGCSLNRFHLWITLDKGNIETMLNQSYDEDLHQAIAALTVKNKLTITATAWQGDMRYCDRYEYMVGCVGLIKQWAITRERSWLTPPSETASHRNSYRTWILKPASASTMHKVPSSAGVEQIHRRLNIREEIEKKIIRNVNKRRSIRLFDLTIKSLTYTDKQGFLAVENSRVSLSLIGYRWIPGGSSLGHVLIGSLDHSKPLFHALSKLCSYPAVRVRMIINIAKETTDTVS